jgi:ankyrin repeat protein
VPFEVASFGDVEMVNFMLDRGAMINLRIDELGETALVKASWAGHNEVVQTLLERGALVDKTDRLGITALMAACMSGKESIARMLLNKGADYNCSGEYRGTPMINAMDNSDDKIVKLLLEKGAEVNTAEKYAGSPLRAAAVKGHESTVRLLVEHGVDLDEEFPLVEALRRGHRNVAKLLVEKGANVNAVEGFHLKDGIPFWLYILPTTRCLARIMSSLLDISSLCLRPKKRSPSKRQEYVWKTVPLGRCRAG